MRRILLVIGGVLIGICLIGYCHDGNAQQPAPDPKLDTYKFLLSEANERVVQANGALAALQAEIAKLKEQAKATEPKKE